MTSIQKGDGKVVKRDVLDLPAACARDARAWDRSPTSTCLSCTTTRSRSTRVRSRSPATRPRVVRAHLRGRRLDPDKPIRKYTKKELHDFLYKEPTKVKVEKLNLTYEGLIPRIHKSFLSKDVDAMQPHIRAFVERAVTFTHLS